MINWSNLTHEEFYKLNGTLTEDRVDDLLKKDYINTEELIHSINNISNSIYPMVKEIHILLDSLVNVTETENLHLICTMRDYLNEMECSLDEACFGVTEKLY
jgi:hypothetical protein